MGKWDGSNTAKLEVCAVRIVFSGRNKECWNRFKSSGVSCKTDSNQAGSVANWITYMCGRRHGYLV